MNTLQGAKKAGPRMGARVRVDAGTDYLESVIRLVCVKSPADMR